MKILRLLNKFYLSVILIFILSNFSFAEEEPIDIWKIENQEGETNLVNNNNENEESSISETDIYKMQSQKKNDSIQLDPTLNSKNFKLLGLYDPEDHGLDINMWLNSDGDQLKDIFSKLNKIDLSRDASEILNISILTNSYYPEKNISEKEFLKLKSDWLIKYSDLELIQEYLIKNEVIDLLPELTQYLVDQHLSEGNVDNACEIFSKTLKPVTNEYLSKFKIYCLIKLNQIDEAQIIYDLKKELGFKDKYFEDKINFLFGYTEKPDENISEETILDFHLANVTNPNFLFEPKDDTSKLIWKYLSSFNLLDSFQKLDVSELAKISTVERAVHNKNYPEKDLFELYKRFQFNINQFLTAKNSYKSLSNIEGRALIYQRLLLESEVVEKLKLLKILKDSFKNENLEFAFDSELKKFLEEIDPLSIPDNLTSFYYTNIEIQDEKERKIKFNNDVMHQSKLINYFNGDFSKNKIEKDVNNFLKKIKKDKKYFFSKKDIIFLESLKADGIEIEKKYDDLYKVNPSEIPTDIQVMINNDEKGIALLRIAEVIGQDDLEKIDEDTIYFIISTLNQLDIDQIRNKILLKVLPFKV